MLSIINYIKEETLIRSTTGSVYTQKIPHKESILTKLKNKFRVNKTPTAELNKKLYNKVAATDKAEVKVSTIKKITPKSM